MHRAARGSDPPWRVSPQSISPTDAVWSRPNRIARQERLAGTPPRPPLLRHTAAITVATTPVRRCAGECYGIDPVPDSPAPATGGHGSGSGRHDLRRTGAGSHSHASPGAGPPLEAAPLSRGREAEPGSRAATVPVFVIATALNAGSPDGAAPGLQVFLTCRRPHRLPEAFAPRVVDIRRSVPAPRVHTGWNGDVPLVRGKVGKADVTPAAKLTRTGRRHSFWHRTGRDKRPRRSCACC